MNIQNKFALSSLGLALLSVCGSTAFAQVAPVDAGAVSQQNRATMAAPTEGKFLLQYDGDVTKEVAPGGPQVPLSKVVLNGNEVFTESALLAVLGDVTGKSYDLAGFRGLANKVSQYYRTHGYPFARAYIPAQSLEGGVLTIGVLEGLYGNVTVKSSERVQSFMQEYLHNLKSGEPIESSKLERSILLMNDIPGFKAVPAVSPGKATGTGDLTVIVSDAPKITGDVSIDNQGTRFTGYHRIQGGFKTADALQLGDEVDVRFMYTGEDMVYGRLGYSMRLVPDNTPPADRLKATFAVSRTQYVLSKEFAALNALGISDMVSAGISYPVIRSQQSNLYASMTVQGKELMDFYRASDTKLNKSSRSAVYAVNFDHRDEFIRGGLTYGALAYTVGNMTNPNDFARTVGEFKKTTFDLVRIQSLTPRFSAFFRYSGQYSRKNLDSSEDIFLGGPNAVRAYPQGEGAGDRGYFTQVEVRYTEGEYSPYAFYDSGRVSVYAEPSDVLPAETRKLAGGGLGLRYNRNKFSLDVTAAWRTQGGKSLADTSSDPKPRVTGTAGYRF